MAESINIFDSASPSSDVRRPEDIRAEYEKIFEAIPHSIEVAGNIFARTAKTHLQNSFFGRGIPVVRWTREGVSALLPVWVAQSSVTLDAQDGRHSFRGELLERLVSSLAGHITSCWHPTHHLNLVDSAFTNIIQTDDTIFSFFVKQKWSLGDL